MSLEVKVIASESMACVERKAFHVNHRSFVPEKEGMWEEIICNSKVTMATLSATKRRRQACPMTCPKEKLCVQIKTSSLVKK